MPRIGSLVLTLLVMAAGEAVAQACPNGHCPCPSNLVLIDGLCQCPPGTGFVDGVCQPT